MTIATYSDLQNQVANWLARNGDPEITSNAVDLIRLAESRLNRLLPLNVNKVDTPLTGTLGSRSIALPADYYEPISVRITTFGIQTLLKPMVSGLFNYGTYNGVPNRWCINGPNIDFDVPCDQAHTFLFRYRKSFALSGTTTTNWLLTNFPDVYLQACLVEADYLCMDFDSYAARKQILEGTASEVLEQDTRNVALATLSADPALMPPVPFNINSGM